MQDLFDNSHHEAQSLINILSFFGHEVPVAMLQLGRKALNDYNVEIRSTDREGSLRRDLDTTFSTLIKYGLIERELQTYVVDETGSLRTQPSFPPEKHSPELTQNGEMESTQAHPRSSIESSSTKSTTTTYSIDILRIHTVVQDFCRDELKMKDREKFWWWLVAAVGLFCLSYQHADEKIKMKSGQGEQTSYLPAQSGLRQACPGLVRDYREYETHAARLYSHLPKDKNSASTGIQRRRHELRRTIRAIKKEIENRSPKHSLEAVGHRVQISIFDRTSSTSSDGPDTPISYPSRASTWTLESEAVSHSPLPLDGTDVGTPFGTVESDDSWPEDKGYESELEYSRASSVTERQTSAHEAFVRLHESDAPNGLSTSQKSSILHAILKGRPVKSKPHKDLGDWRPLPTTPALTHINAAGTSSKPSSRTSSSDERSNGPVSAGSQAEAALAAVHRLSPLASRGEGRIRSSSLTAHTASSEKFREPLSNRSPNLQLSPLAAEFHPGQGELRSKSSSTSRLGSAVSTRHHSRHTTVTSPRNFVHEPISRTPHSANSDKALPPLPIDENITVTRASGTPPFNRSQAHPKANSTQPLLFDNPDDPASTVPTGYASQPMSRDPSHESTFSLATAPPAPRNSALLTSADSSPPPGWPLQYTYKTRPVALPLQPGSSPGRMQQSLSPISTATNRGAHDVLNRVGGWTSSGLSPVTPLKPVLSMSLDSTIENKQPAGQERNGTKGETIQFGDASPVDLAQARTRADEYAKKLTPSDKGAYRRRKSTGETVKRNNSDGLSDRPGPGARRQLKGLGVSLQ